MRLKLPDLIFVSVMIVIVSYVCVLYLTSCDEYLSKTQCEARSKPADVNQAKAMVILEQGKQEAQQKAKSAAQIDSIKFWCFLGLGGALVAMFLGTIAIKRIGFGLAIVCGVMIAIVQFYQTFSVYFAYIGGIIALGAGIYAIFKHRIALIQAVKTGEVYKVNITTGLDKIGEKIKTEIQSPTTTKLISSIREKL